MSDDVLQVHGYGFVFAGNFIGIVPAQFLESLEQVPKLKKKLQDKAPRFSERIELIMREGKELAGGEEELNDLLYNYEEDHSAEKRLAVLYAEAQMNLLAYNWKCTVMTRKGTMLCVLFLLHGSIPRKNSMSKGKITCVPYSKHAATRLVSFVILMSSSSRLKYAAKKKGKA